jgi:hypothetical protein
MSDVGVVFPPWVTAWVLLGEAVPYTTAAMRAGALFLRTTTPVGPRLGRDWTSKAPGLN